MPFDFSKINLVAAPWSEAIYQLKEALKANGWTVEQSSDGTTFNGSSDIITHGGSGAGGFDNSRAWFVILQPGGAGTRRLCFQRGTSTNTARVKYSHSAAYNAGAPSATVTPTLAIAADDRILAGGGTDASPTFSTVWTTNTRAHVVVETAGLGFYVAGYSFTGLGSTQAMTGGGMFFEKLEDNTFDAADTDPYVMHVAGQSTVFATATLGIETGGPFERVLGYLARGLGGEGFVPIPSCRPTRSGSVNMVGVVGSNIWDDREPLLPVLYARRSAATAPRGWKGQSRFFRWRGTQRFTNDTLASRTWIVLGDLLAPWDGSTVPRLG